MIYYKIRRKSNPELFLTASGDWNKSGKVFDTLGKLRQKLTYVIKYNKKADLSDWEIVEYEVTEKEVKGVHEVIKADKLVYLLKR